MSFEAYLANIKAKTGLTPEEFYHRAKPLGLVAAGAKATPLVAWLKQEFSLGHGHSMAIWEAFKRKGWIERSVAERSRVKVARADRAGRTR